MKFRLELAYLTLIRAYLFESEGIFDELSNFVWTPFYEHIEIIFLL